MVDDPIDLDQARTLLRAIDASIDGLASPLAFDDLLVRVAASARTVVHDWRGELEEGLAAIASVLAHDGHDIQYELGEDGARAVVRYGGRAADIKCVPADDDDFKDVAATIERLLDGLVQFRRSPDSCAACSAADAPRDLRGARALPCGRSTPPGSRASATLR